LINHESDFINSTLRGDHRKLIESLQDFNSDRLQKELKRYVWEFSKENIDCIKLEYQPLVAMYINDWRGHRLFGLEPPPEFNDEDLRGHDCFLTVSYDRYLGTMTEHYYGTSIWCRRERMDAGQFDGGQVLRHSNG
jgi:hypothetical protein